MNTTRQPATTAKELAALLKKLDSEKRQKITAILTREGVMAGCFSQYCKGTLHAHAPTS